MTWWWWAEIRPFGESSFAEDTVVDLARLFPAKLAVVVEYDGIC